MPRNFRCFAKIVRNSDERNAFANLFCYWGNDANRRGAGHAGRGDTWPDDDEVRTILSLQNTKSQIIIPKN